MITRDEALTILNQHVSSVAMIKHSIASEAVLRAIAVHLKEDEVAWALAGLLHDVDVELTHGDAKTHGTLTPQLLSSFDIPTEVIEAIVMHNEDAATRLRASKLEHALAAGETITGLIMATAFVYPDRKLASVKTKSITKRMREKNFAASVKRENILECEEIGIPIDQFAQLSLTAMSEIASDLGL